MTRTSFVICLLLSMTCVASDEVNLKPVNEAQGPAVGPAREIEPDVEELQTSESVAPETDQDLSDHESSFATLAQDQPLTLAELLKQVRKTPHLQREAMLARLAERRRLAIALRTTLEAAEQVAAFGPAGTQLLNDASLDTVVATMIDEKESERLAIESSQMKSESIELTNVPSVAEDSDDNLDAASEPGFETWRPVYILKDSHAQKVGWHHLNGVERKVTYVGEIWEVGDDIVTVVAVGLDQNRRYLLIELNGERREVDLY